MWTGQEERTKVYCLFANASFLSLYLSKQLQDMDFVLVVIVVVVEELEHLKLHLVVNYWGREGNSLTPHMVPGDTRGCPNTAASCHSFREKARDSCLRVAPACWTCSRMWWTEMCLSKRFEGSQCWWLQCAGPGHGAQQSQPAFWELEALPVIIWNLQKSQLLRAYRFERKTFPVSSFPLQRTQKDKLHTNSSLLSVPHPQHNSKTTSVF